MANDIKLKLSVDGARVVSQQIDGVTKNLGDMDRNANLASVGMKKLTGMLGGFSAALTIGKLVSVQREFDVLNSSLITVTGSSAKAAQEFAWIKQFAATTPYQLNEVTGAFVKMKALGLDASAKALGSYGNTASAMGKGLNQMIEAVADAATGEFERLKEFGIKAKQQGDQVSLTFQGTATKIGNNAGEITRYLQALGDKEFAGAMALRAATLDGAISNLTDTWDELFRTVSANNAGTLIFDSVTLASSAIKDAITVLNALNGAAAENAKQTGAMATVQEALAITFETVAVLGANVKHVLVQVGTELGGIAAQAVQILQGNFSAAASIRNAMKADAAAARAEIDATTARILGARAAAQDLAAWNTRNASAGADPRRLDLATAANAVTEKSIKLTKEQTDAIKAAAKARAEAADYNTKAVDALYDAQEKSRLQVEDSIKTARTTLEQIEFETALLTMNTEQRALATLERELERQGIVKGMLAYDAYIVKLREAMAIKSGKEAGIKAADDMADAQKKAAEESGKWWEDALMRAFESGKGFFRSLWDTIKNTLKTQVLRVLVSATGLTGMSSAGAGDLAGGGGGGNLLGTAANLGKMYDTITGGFAGLSDSVAFAAQDVGAWLVNNTSGVLNQAGASLMQGAGTFGTVAGYAAGAAAGLAIGKAISGGYGSNTAVNAGTIIGSVLGGPIGGAIGGAIGGLVNRAFGRKATELLSSGTRGTFSGEAFEGVNYANYQKKGGWFRSDKNWTDTTAMDATTLNAWSSAFAGVKGSVAGMAASLGLATDKIVAYSKYVDVAAGTTQEQLTAIFAGMADEMALAAAPGLSAFAQAGESANTTLSRLGGSLQVVNMWLDALDHSLLAVSLSGGDAASKLADAFGGLDAMATASKAYYDLFWSDADRLADTASNVAKGLALVNVAMPITKDAFRDVVSALDLTTDAGRNTYAVMLALAPEFAQVADAAAVSVNSFFDTLQKRLTELQQSIASERESVAGARAGILATPKTAAQLAAEIAATKVAMPSDVGVISAMVARTAAQAGVAAAQSAQSATGSVYGTVLSSAQAGLTSTVDYYKNLAARFQARALDYAIRVNATGTNNDAYSYNAATNSLNPWNYNSDHTPSGRSYGHYLEDAQRFTNEQYANGTVPALQGGNADLANAAAAVATAQAAYNSAMTATAGILNTAAAAKNAADAAVKQAVLDYATAMMQYSGDAEKAVKVLGTLREETVAYYEAQKELAGLLTASAANLREAVRSTRFGQLDEQAGLAQQQSSFAQNYGMALATTGTTKAGYADQLGAALPGLSTALMDASATRADWALATSSLFAQSDTIAAQLEAEAGGMSYQTESLALLDSIDVSLMELGTNTAILKNAIDGGASTTAAGLRAIVTQLGGVPAFASGGYHAGGARIVGENGPELEVTGPSHIYSASQTRGMLSGGGNTARLEALVERLTAEVEGLRAEAQATAGHTSKTARLLDRAMPDGDALATRVAV